MSNKYYEISNKLKSVCVGVTEMLLYYFFFVSSIYTGRSIDRRQKATIYVYFHTEQFIINQSFNGHVRGRVSDQGVHGNVDIRKQRIEIFPTLCCTSIREYRLIWKIE